jgi:hypothetical protein
MLQEKWNSRCGWLDEEWNEWFDKAVKDRQAEREFWERAQERVVRERRVGIVSSMDGKSGGVAGDVKGVAVGVPEKRKSVFRRLFRVGRVGK